MLHNSSHNNNWFASLRNGSRRADGKCIACSQLLTLSTACACLSSHKDTDDNIQYRQGRNNKLPDSHDEFDLTDASRNSSLLSTHSCSRQGSNDDLVASSFQNVDEYIVVEEMPSRQSSVLSSVREPSRDNYTRMHRGKARQESTVNSQVQYLIVRGVSSIESLLSAKRSNLNNDGCWLVTKDRQLSAIRSGSSSRQSKLPSTVGEKSLDSQTSMDNCKIRRRRFCTSSAYDNQQQTDRLDVDETADDTLTSSDSDTRQVSSSEASLLSAKGSDPENDEWTPMTYTCQSNESDSYEMTDREPSRQSSQLSAVEEQSPVSQTTAHYSQTHREFSVNSSPNNRQHANRLKAEESTDTVSTFSPSDARKVSSSNVSSLSAKGSSPDNDGWTLITDGCQPSETDSSSVVVLDLANRNNTSNYRGSSQQNRDENVQRVHWLPAESECSDDEKSRTNSTPKARSSVTETVSTPVKERSRPVSDRKSEKKKELGADKMSEIIEGLLRSGNFVYCCSSHCRLRTVAPCDACSSTYYNKKRHDKDTARHIAVRAVESQSTSSEREELETKRAPRTESLVTSDDDHRSSIVSTTSGDRVSHTSVSDNDVDDQYRCEVDGNNESTDESEVSAGDDDEDERQQSSIDGDRNRAPAERSYRGTSHRCVKRVTTKDSEMSAWQQSAVTSRCESLVRTESCNAGRQKGSHWQRRDTASKSADHHYYNDDDVGKYHGVMTAKDDGRRCSVSPPCLRRTESRATETTSACCSRSSCSSKKLDASDSEHFDDDDTETQSINETRSSVSGVQYQVISIYGFLFGKLAFFLYTVTVGWWLAHVPVELKRHTNVSRPAMHNKFGDRSFSATGRRLWNGLPDRLQWPDFSFPVFGQDTSAW